MNSSDQYLSPKPDAREKTLGGIDLHLEQSNSLSESSAGRYQNLQKPHSKFAATGLWRKKRDVASIKIKCSR
jgi:hypothetical protein